MTNFQLYVLLGQLWAMTAFTLVRKQSSGATATLLGAMWAVSAVVEFYAR